MGAITSEDLDVHAPSHGLRYLGILVGAAALGAAIWGFNTYTGQQDRSKLLGFDAFRAAYADKCGVASYAGEQPEVIRNAYLSTPSVQAAMEKELTALNAGASCSEVVSALKRVDFALPVSTP